MLLERKDAELFFWLHRTFMFYVNQRLNVLSAGGTTPEAFSGLSAEHRLKVREAWLANPDLLESFIAENPSNLSKDELAMVSAWRHHQTGKFYVFRYLRKYTVFLSASEPTIAYGVLGLAQPIEELVGPYLPVLVQTMLLPFKDQIVYDSVMTSYSISFGAGIRSSLNDAFKTAKAQRGIVTSLPISDQPPKATRQRNQSTGRRRAARSARKTAASTFAGSWRITSMELWDQDFIDAEVEAYIDFRRNGLGSFQFGYVSGDIDYRNTTRDGKPAVEWSWTGNDEMDPVSGRGWAVLDGNKLQGIIALHHGDESRFEAEHKR